MSPVTAEHRAQQRACGKIIKGPERPIIASRHLEKRSDHQGVVNAKQRAEFYRRWYGKSSANIQIMRFAR